MYNLTYTQVYLFGFSGGGAVVGNEIQKDYASRFSAAVMNCAPVNWSGYSTDQIYQTAVTASKAKAATFFPENVDDRLEESPPFYLQMKGYYDNEIVDKEWLNWTGGHGSFFDPACAGPSGENDSEVVINWYDAPHPPSTPFTPTGSQTGYCGMPNRYSSGMVDPNGENVSYTFEWGDNANCTTEFYPSGTNVTCSHTWSNPGVYNVTVLARDTSQTNSSWSQPLTVNITSLLEPLCALKTKTDGYFYVPNESFVNATYLRVEMLFDQANLTGDQRGGISPYPAIANYPSGSVLGDDIAFISSKFGSYEGETAPIQWNYMTDVVADGNVNGRDIATAARNFGAYGSYSYDLSNVSIAFYAGGNEIGNETPDANGFAAIQLGATSFNVTRNGMPIGAMIIFCGS